MAAFSDVYVCSVKTSSDWLIILASGEVIKSLAYAHAHFQVRTSRTSKRFALAKVFWADT
eukprot:5699014-Pyramimonas_sp.AAC.1